jgi:dephospho-CoA kinase
MLKVGLTGNLGSGKSLIAKIFRILSVPIYNADDISKSFLSDKIVQDKIRNVFGQEVFSSSDEIDRRTLGNVVFSDVKKLNTLNAILHPLVMDNFRSWCNSCKGKPYIIHEAAIIFESGYRHEFDKIIHVSCPEEICIERAIYRDHTDRNTILKRMNIQWKNEKKALLSDFVILNDGSEMVIPQVLRINDLLSKSSITA